MSARSPLALLAELRRSGHLDETSFAVLWRATSARLSPPLRASATDETTAEEEEEEPSEEEEEEKESANVDEAASSVWSKAEQASFARHVRDWEWHGYPAMHGGARASAVVRINIKHWQRLAASVAAECGTQARPILSSYSKACKLRRGQSPWGARSPGRGPERAARAQANTT
jgi:hypothetical protein